ncbi:tetratricopeptide repeat protein [Arenicella xantha]|nr:hypothetical protein [Arenicella xantha]
MEQTTIQELIQIKYILMVIAALLAVLVVGKLCGVIGNLINNWRAYSDSRIRVAAIDMFDRAEYVELEKFLQEKLILFPNNATAIYWMARCNLSSSNIEKAKEYFMRLKALEPSWETEYVTPFLKEIDEKH